MTDTIETMIITADLSEAAFWEKAGVDIVFVDLEQLGKIERQSHVDSVKSCHTIADVAAVKGALRTARVLVRINPVHKGTAVEVEAVLEAGADIIMLPMFETAAQVRDVLALIDGRCAFYPLLETPAALAIAGDLADIQGVSGYHFGLNDLHLAMGKAFMFEVMLESAFKRAIEIFRDRGIFFGIGGISRVGMGTLLSDVVIRENYNLGSRRVILSRSFKAGIESDAQAAREIVAVQQVYRNSAIEDLGRNRDIFVQQVEVIAKHV